ncbi:MAG: outer membrane protein assembly factor BamC, partial [Thiothrix sp.]
MNPKIRRPQSRVTLQALLLGGSVAGLSACSMLDGIDDVRDSINYRNPKTVNALEVPPDLNTPDYDLTYATIPGGSVSASALARGQGPVGAPTVLPTHDAIKLMREGNVRWLQVNAPPELLWTRLQDFWRVSGINLKRSEPRVGIMETDWAENRAEIPLSGIHKLLDKAFEGMYDAGSRDRFKVRLERPSAQTTNVYISHERAEEVVTGAGVSWQYVPAKPELEAEMLNRLMVFLQGGDPAEQTGQMAESQMTSVPVSMAQLDGGQPALAVGGSRNQVWIRTGVMLGRIGMSIDAQQRANGVYLATYDGGKEKRTDSFFSRL